MSKRLACESLHSCAGCEIAFLGLGEALIPLFSRLQPVHFPLLMDHKYFKESEPDSAIALPEADIGMVSGGIANHEQLQIVQAMRDSCTTLIALGTCATHGGIPAMINQWPMNQAVQTVFSTATTKPQTVPRQNVPRMLDRVYSLDEKVAVDIFLPGCPPTPAMIGQVLEDVLDDRVTVQPGKSVCDTCTTNRTGTGEKKPRRFTVNAQYDRDEPTSSMRCLLEQGFLCMGPVTASGCSRDGEPDCIRARVPCRGCFGPVRRQDNQMLAMMNGLISQGVDLKSIIDRKSMLRFSGAHGQLRPIKKRGKE